MKTKNRVTRSIRFLALTPFWLLQLGTGAKSFRDNPVLGSRRLNAAGLHVARLKVAHRLAARRRAALAHALADIDRAALDRDGMIAIPDFLPASDFAALSDTLLSTPAPSRETIQGGAVTRRSALDAPPLADRPAVRRLLANPRWRALLRYAGSFAAEPVHYVQTIFAQADEGEDPQTQLHADTFHPTVKAWLFLRDVGVEDGPFVYVPGSGRLTAERLAWERARSVRGGGEDVLSARGSPRVTPQDLTAMGLSQPVAFPARANTLIVADTFGFHARGAASRPSTRLEVWSYGRRNPFLPATGLDLAALPAWRRWRVPGLWWAGDRLARWRHQHWRSVGTILPQDPRAD